jgi:serine/threonine-protein kinase
LVIRGPELCRLDKASQKVVPVVSDVAGAIDVAVDPSTGDAVLVGAGFATRVDRSTGVATPLPGFAEFTRPVGVAVGSDGTIVVVDTRVGEIVSVAPGGEPTSQTANPQFDQPRDIAVQVDGNVVVCGGPDGQGKVMRGNPRDGTTSVVASSGTLSVRGGVTGPIAIAIEPNGTILTLRPYKRTVQGVPLDNGDLIRVFGKTTALFGGFSRLSDPAALDVAPDGTIVVATRGGVFAVDPVTHAITQLSSEMVGRLAVVPSLSPEKIVGQSN